MRTTELYDKGPGLSRRGFLGLAAAAGATLALSGCGKSAASAGSTGGSLRVGVVSAGSVSSIDPDTGALASADKARYASLYDTLLKYDENFRVQPHLADEIVPEADGMAWTLRLRQGVEFHNGKTMTAKDVVFSLRRHGSPSSVHASLLQSVDLDNLQVIDDRTVRIPMHSPNATLRETLCIYPGYVLPEGYDPSNPIGTGPFRFVSFDPGRGTRLSRFENYAFGPALVDDLRLVDFTDAAAMTNALLSEQVHAITDLPVNQVKRLQNNSAVRPLVAPSSQWRPFVMNMSVEPFRDVRVRQAMRLLANRQQLVDIALDGQGVVANDVFGVFDPAYIGNELPQRTQDIDQAKWLLAQAGYPDLSLELTTSDIAPGVIEASTLYAAQAAEGGVNIAIRRVPASDFFGPRWLSYSFTVDAWQTPGYMFPASSSLGPSASFNETHFEDAEWTALYEKALREFDDVKRADILGQLQRIDYERGGYLIWSFSNFTGAVSNRTTGWPEGRFSNPLGDFGFSKVSIV